MGAIQFDFYKLGRGVANGDFLPTDGVPCTGGDLSSSNVNGGIFGGDLTFTLGGLTAVATGTYNGNMAAVVQDHESNWSATKGAGLGVYHSKNTSDDNVTMNEVLTITFDQVVHLTEIGLRAEGHNYTGWDTGDKFLFNGVQTTLPDNVGSIAMNRTGNVFTFAFDSSQSLSSQFYLSSMTASTVPDGGATFALLSVGLLAVGTLHRRLYATLG